MINHGGEEKGKSNRVEFSCIKSSLILIMQDKNGSLKLIFIMIAIVDLNL